MIYVLYLTLTTYLNFYHHQHNTHMIYSIYGHTRYGLGCQQLDNEACWHYCLSPQLSHKGVSLCSYMTTHASFSFRSAQRNETTGWGRKITAVITAGIKSWSTRQDDRRGWNIGFRLSGDPLFRPVWVWTSWGSTLACWIIHNILGYRDNISPTPQIGMFPYIDLSFPIFLQWPNIFSLYKTWLKNVRSHIQYTLLLMPWHLSVLRIAYIHIGAKLISVLCKWPSFGGVV